MAVQFKKLTTSLPSGTNTHTFTDSLINNDSVIEVYTDNDDVYPVDLSQSDNNVTVTFSDHDTSVAVALTINNVVSFEPVDISGIESDIETLQTHVDNIDEDITGLTTVVNEISDNIDTIEGDVSTLGTMVTDLETNKQDLLIPGDNITIVDNVISASGGSSGQGVGFLDASRLIYQDTTEITNRQPYTCTENCWLSIVTRSGSSGSSAQAFINGSMVVANATTNSIIFLIPARKNDVLSFRQGSFYYALRVYGMM